MKAEIRNKSLCGPGGEPRFRCDVVVVDAGGEPVLTRSLDVRLDGRAVSQGEIQELVNETKARALREAQNAASIDLDAIQ